MAATSDGAVLLVNVHVGGVPRSTDSGLTWRPPIDINSDVHQVCAHPTRPDIVIAAAGLCISRDAGATWTIESRDFTPIIALPLLLGGTTFSYQHPPTLLRRKAQSIDARSPATVATAFARRHAEEDRRHRRYQLHRDPAFNGPCDRPIGMPLRVA